MHWEGYHISGASDLLSIKIPDGRDLLLTDFLSYTHTHTHTYKHARPGWLANKIGNENVSGSRCLERHKPYFFGTHPFKTGRNQNHRTCASLYSTTTSTTMLRSDDQWFFIRSLSTGGVVTASTSSQDPLLRSQVYVRQPQQVDNELWCWDDRHLVNKATQLVLDIRKGNDFLFLAQCITPFLTILFTSGM